LQLFTRHGKRLNGITSAGDQIIVHARMIIREVECIRGVSRESIKDARVRGVATTR